MGTFLDKATPAIMSEGNVYISNNTIVVGSVALLVSNLSSFSQGKLPNRFRLLLGAAGILMTLWGLTRVVTGEFIILLVGIALLAAANFMRSKYGIMLESNSGLQRFIVSTNMLFIDKIVAGLYKAANSGYSNNELVIYNIESASIKTGDIYKDISGSSIFSRSNVKAGEHPGGSNG
ncbi:DUF6232 family protein [Desulfolutivibrio sulfoxidireducens]|uniref:DUF6232 family protein n=1 Tax=Desulfolutivibrio sulfoxidireducens TaxID=2773299 RepID=UPI00159E546B|nr:DUF6232 family protein [Desulfolutivibrio sulfoxidireducens]QLA15687.1 hypothetical protein GD605_05745 [Desulfolutivibrio sulfoxidireducens]